MQLLHGLKYSKTKQQSNLKFESIFVPVLMDDDDEDDGGGSGHTITALSFWLRWDQCGRR